MYLAGYGVQLDSENYFVPVDAKIASASDVAAEAPRLSDYYDATCRSVLEGYLEQVRIRETNENEPTEAS